MDQWETLLANFTPDEMVSFEIQPKKDEVIGKLFYYQVYYETIEHETVIRGAYFVDYESKEKIDFQVNQRV